MERHFDEKHSPASLNFVLICQDFASPPTLRLYLESKGCLVVQQDDTIVGIGATTPFPGLSRSGGDQHMAMNLATPHGVEIHAYLRTPLRWKADWAAALHGGGNGRSIGDAAEDDGTDREEHLCLAFARAMNIGESSSRMSYRFFDDAMARVRNAYAQHARRAAPYLDAPMALDETRPVKESIHLTAREHEILKWVSEGKGCWETGAILGISERTVKFHLQNIYRKLNVVNRAQAITKAMRYALI